MPLLDPKGEYIQEHWRNRVLPMTAERGLVMRIPPAQTRTRPAHESKEFAQAVDADILLGQRLGISSVPTMLVADETGRAEPVVGAVPYEVLHAAVERALTRLRSGEPKLRR